jgi:hypothetical protein
MHRTFRHRRHRKLLRQRRRLACIGPIPAGYASDLVLAFEKKLDPQKKSDFGSQSISMTRVLGREILRYVHEIPDRA